jgi:cytochrome P450
VTKSGERTYEEQGGAALTPMFLKLFAPEHRQNPYPIFNYLRDSRPDFRSELGVRLLSRHADCASVLRDPHWGHGDMQERFRTSSRETPQDRLFMRLDPPDHTRLRSLVSKAFKPRTIGQLRSRIEELAVTLLARARDEAGPSDPIDIVDRYAYPLMLTMITDLLGIPFADHALFRTWSQALARGLDPEFAISEEDLKRRDSTWKEFHAYFTDLAAERRARPMDDLFSGLVGVEEEGSGLTLDELVATCVLLLVAGHETTVSLISNGILSLLLNPDELTRARSADRPSGWIDELLRFEAPVQFTARLALTDTELNRQAVPAGEMAVILIAAANRDPNVFPDPDRLDLSRAAGRQLSLGAGIHFCLGASLARLGGEVALLTLLGAAPRLALATDDVTYRDNLVLRCPAALPVYLQ